MGTGGSKGAAAAAAAAAAAVDPGAVADGGPGNAAERMGWRRSRMQGLSCFCFSCSASPDEEKEIKGERHRGRNGFCVAEDAVESKRGRLTDCLQFLLPCRGRVISSPSSDAEQREHYLDSASSSSDSDVGAVATAQTSGDPLSRPRPRFCFISDSVISSLGSATSPSTISPTNPSANAESSEDHGACAREGATRTRPGAENLGRRQSRRNGAHDPLEGSVRFSRTLSVGRLRDRVLRRSTFSESLFAPSSLEDGQVRALSLGAMDSANRDDDQRATFLERRRRLRSQVWALQRLGSRMESVPGHERSCLLCSQPSAGRCTCGTADGSNPRSSISRIVMLAEALFEVLDEIHQQAVVLASRPSVSSMGSVPAPREAVDCIPLRIHRRMDEAAQCYICLLDYEEGDAVRVLPCGHEFHQPCVDKWLTDIHRVCPLCRADVCISELTPPEKPARCS